MGLKTKLDCASSLITYMSRITAAAAAPTSNKLSSLCEKTSVRRPLSPLAVSSTPLPRLPPGTLPVKTRIAVWKTPTLFLFLSNSAARLSLGLLNRAKMRPLCPFNTDGIRTSPNGGPRTVSSNVRCGADRLSLSCLANSELISWINVSATNQLWATVTLTSHCLLRHGWLCKF